MDKFLALAHDNRVNSMDKAVKTAKSVLKYVKENKQRLTAQEIFQNIETMGREIGTAANLCFPVTNTFKRIISSIRKLLLTDADKQLKDIAKIERKVTQEDDGDEPMEDIGEMILLIQEIIDDFDDGFIDISKTLQPHIGAEDIILTFGYSKLALACFQEAKEEDKDIKVLVVDEQYVSGSQKMVTELTSLSIESYRVSLASVFTVMPKITKVIVGSYAVLADGGILGFSGIYALGMIAKEFSVPFLVVSSLYKLTPKYSFNQQTFNSFLNPNQIIKIPTNLGEENVNTVIPRFDFVPPEFIMLHITQKGEHTTSYIYRLFNEIYMKEETNADY